MTPGTTALVARVLKLREARDRAALMAAQEERDRQAVAAAELAAAIAAEQGFVDSGAAALLGGPGLGLWRLAAQAQAAAAAAEAACAAPQEELTESVRMRRGFATMCEQQAAAAAREAERRDPVRALMLLPKDSSLSE